MNKNSTDYTEICLKKEVMPERKIKKCHRKKQEKEARMKKLGKFKLFSLLIFLSVALVFIGVNFLESGKPPKWEWKVGIPSEPMAAQEKYNCNLYGNPYGNQVPGIEQYITYENNEFIEVLFWKSEDKDTGEIHSTFSLKIENTEKAIPDYPGYYSIGFRDIWFMGCRTYCTVGGTGPCRCLVLPGSDYPEGLDCCHADVNCTGPGSSGFWRMKNFMETNAHPSWGYDNFSLRFWVYTDIEAIDIGETWEGEGYLWRLDVWNTGETLLEGNEAYHNIVPAYWIPLEEVLVERSGDNEWIITVDQCGRHDPDGGNDCESILTNNSGRYIVFYEFYYQGIEKPIGKSGKSKIESQRRWALGGATKFKFITKWARVEQSKGGRSPK